MLKIQAATPQTQNRIFNNLSIDFEEHKVHAVLCSNMSALDELADMFARQIQLESGCIELDGVPISHPSAYMKIEYVLKTPMLFKGYTVAENVYMTEKSFGLFQRKSITKQCRALFAKFQYSLDPLAYVEALSYEHLKIIELFRSYVKRPKLLILYETINSVSPIHSDLFSNLLEGIRENGTTILFLTSKWEDAIRIADAITVLTNGEVKGVYSSEEVQRDPSHIYALLMGGQNFMVGYNGERNNPYVLLDLITESAELISAESNINNALKIFTRKINKTLGAAGCVIYLLDENRANIIDLVADFSAPGDEVGGFRLSCETINRIVDSQPGFAYSNRNDKSFAGLFEQETKMETLLGVSIRLRNQVIGFIQVCFLDYYVYSEEDTIYLLAISNEIAIMIENSRLLGKSVLLQESHHRIKNNLQMIINLMQMQKHAIACKLGNPEQLEEINGTIDATVSRIKSISTIHDIISKENSSSFINIQHIIYEIQKFYSFSAEIEIDTAEVLIPHSRATSLALIVNELINNSIRHAPEGKAVTIRLNLREQDDQIHLDYRDNGAGYPEGFSVEGSSTIGMTVLTSIVTSEFNGKLTFFNDDGACVRIAFPRLNFL